MKSIIFGLLLLPLTAIGGANDIVVCDVKACNKLERFTLDPWSMLQDKMGEVCEDVTVYKKEAVIDNILSSETRWYQGSSINPTKASVTRVKEIYKCYMVQE